MLVPAGTCTPATSVSTLATLRQLVWGDSNRSTSSSAAGTSDGSAQSSLHWSRRDSRQISEFDRKWLTISWPANDRPYTIDSTSR